MARNRTLVFVAMTIALLAALVAVSAIFFLRATANPAILIENAGEQPLEQMRCILSVDGIAWTERVDKIEPGEDVEFTRSTSDLFVQSLEYSVQGELHQWEEGGIAAKGETLLLQINDQGDVSTSYVK